MKLLQLLPFFDPTVERWAPEARILRWLTLIWLLVGLAVLFSASYPTAAATYDDGLRFFKFQLLWTAIGLVVFNVVVHFPLRGMLRLGSILLFVMLGLLFATHIPGFGKTQFESTRWLSLGSLFVQPSELVKPFLVLQAAQLFAYWDRKPWSVRLGWLAVFALALLGILLQPSLSMTMLCGFTLWAIALAAGLPWSYLLGTVVVGGLGAALSVAANEYQWQRIAGFLDPWADERGIGFQLVQSLLTVGSGQVWGVGYGLSRQKSFLPVQHTDFIFSVFAEEFGLIGGLCLIAMLAIFGAVGIWVAYKCKDPIVRLVALGATVLLVGQSFFNIGVAIGVLPTTGLPFPLFSYGGNAMVSSLFVAGLLVRSAREMASAEMLPITDRRSRQGRQGGDRNTRRRVYSGHP